MRLQESELKLDVPARRSSLEHPFNSSRQKSNPFFKKRKTVDSPADLRSKPGDITSAVSPPRPMLLDFEAQLPNIISNIEMIQEQEEVQIGEAELTMQPQNNEDLPVCISSPVVSNRQVSLACNLSVIELL